MPDHVGRYDIYCPLMGKDSRVANYFSHSCRTRQAARACTDRGCPRFLGKKAVRQHRLKTPLPRPAVTTATPPVPVANPVKPAKQGNTKLATRRPRRPVRDRAPEQRSSQVFDPAVYKQRGGIEVTLVIPDTQLHLYQVLANAARRHRLTLQEEILARLARRLKP